MTAHLKHSSSLFCEFITAFYFLAISATHCKSHLVSALAYESLCKSALFYPVKNYSQVFGNFQLVRRCVQAYLVLNH